MTNENSDRGVMVEGKEFKNPVTGYGTDKFFICFVDQEFETPEDALKYASDHHMVTPVIFRGTRY